MKRRIAVIVPARNEEKTLETCLKQLLTAIDKKDIYFIDDSSSDTTATIAKKLLKNIIFTSKNIGKANGINLVIKKFKLVQKYDLIFPLDADTKLGEDFISNITAVFKADKSKKIAAAMGQIRGFATSGTSAYRVWEYEIAQAVHKQAQNKIGSITVCSGCATVYRSELFNKIKFSNETLTEDMDLTFEIHRKSLGKIVYIPKAYVYTQDPQKLMDFKKQLDRWYAGFWQCIFKHKVASKRQILDLEAGIAALEGIFNGLFILVLLILLPFFIFKAGWVLLFSFMLDLFIFTLPTMAYVALRQNSWAIFQYTPYFYFLRIFSSLVFLKSYLVVALGADNYLSWKQAKRFNFKGAENVF